MFKQMNINEASKQEYISRINKVMDYVDKHIDQTLSLGDFVQRIRVEKAWSTVCLWITESGYQPYGNAYELYYSFQEDDAQGKFDLEVCVLLRQLQ